MTAGIRAQFYDPATGETAFGSAELIEAWKQAPEALIWVDFHDVPAAEESRLMADEFGIDPSVIKDAQKLRFPPKLERHENYTFLLLKGLDAETADISFSTIQIALLVGHRFFLTRHNGLSLSTDRLWAETEARPARIAQGCDALATALVAIIIGRYLPILLAVETRLDDLEEEVANQPRDALLTELIGLKSNLTRMRRVTTYHAHVFKQVVEAPPHQFSPSLKDALADIEEDLERAVSLTALYYDLAADLMDGYISLASHRLNTIMKVLTVVASIFIPLTFIAGIYGMNFENMPELHTRYGYFVLLGVMLLVGGGLAALFKWKRWL